VAVVSDGTAVLGLGDIGTRAAMPAMEGKAATEHRHAYDPIARASYTVDLPGPYAGNLKRLLTRSKSRPIYPLDDM
jgi:Malic enzyme, N-terminal domain